MLSGNDLSMIKWLFTPRELKDIVKEYGNIQ
jgi:hypothetical protein